MDKRTRKKTIRAKYNRSKFFKLLREKTRKTHYKKKGGTRMMMPSGYFGKRHPRYQSKSKRCLKVKYI